MNNLNSKIVLGTAQFGLSYGVSNKFGKTDESEVEEILNFAQNIGIHLIDTASQYGDSETIIGKLASRNHWRIITKIPSFRGSTNKNYKLMVRNTFNRSLDNLNRDSIDSVLVHSCDDLFTDFGRTMFEGLLDLKQDRKVNKIGVSVYNKNQIDRLLRDFDIDILQIPISIYDQRLIQENYLRQIKSYGIELHARSIFLQGLVLMNQFEIPSFFKPITKQIKLFQTKAREASISQLSLALSFVNSLEGLDYIVVGVNNLKQLEEIVDSEIVDIQNEDYSDLAVFDEKFVNPSKWILN
jgi:aryl-alcohol dehydrogenase-like predicted oxidoreductase